MTNEHNLVGWFEIPVTDMGRARTFYEHVFEIELEEHPMGSSLMAWFPMWEGKIGAAGSLVKGEGYKPSPAGTLVYFTAPDIEAALTRAEENGGRVLTPRTGIGEFGFFGIMLDTEGNRIGLHSRF